MLKPIMTPITELPPDADATAEACVAATSMSFTGDWQNGPWNADTQLHVTLLALAEQMPPF